MDTLPHHAHEGNSSFIALPVGGNKTTIIDTEDADLSQWHWFVSTGHYVIRKAQHRKVSTTFRLHTVILERKLGRTIIEGMQVDHINGDRLDNRRDNLREVTPQQNQINRRPRIERRKGIVQDNRTNKWMACIRHNGAGSFYLGSFSTPEEAALVYDRAAVAKYGEYARTNNKIVQMVLWNPLDGTTLPEHNTSGFRGIERRGEKWKATIVIAGHKNHLGTFSTPREAALAYDNAAKHYHGDKAKLNFPEEDK